MILVDSKPAKWKVKRVLRYGHSRALTLTPFIPREWENVMVRLEEKSSEEALIRLRKLPKVTSLQKKVSKSSRPCLLRTSTQEGPTPDTSI